MDVTHKADLYMRALFDASPHVRVLFDDDFNVMDCNPAACALLGFATREDLISGFRQRINEIVPESHSGKLPSVRFYEMLETASTKGSLEFETELHIDGTVKTLDVEVKKVPYGDSFAIVLYVSDITDIREHEKELIITRERSEFQLLKMNLMVKATKIGLWDMEVVRDDPVNLSNPFNWSTEIRHMLGFENEDDFPNLLCSLVDRMHPEDRGGVIRDFEKHLTDTTGKTPFDIEYRVQRKSGEYIHFRASGDSIRDENGFAIRVAGAVLDVTNIKTLIKEAERQRMDAEAANKAKSAFLSTMSHEIRTPMNAILGITEIQLQKENLDPDVKLAFDRIYTSGDLLLGIINDTLDLSKIEAGKFELITGKYEVASLVSDTAQLNMMRIGSKAIEFKMDVDENVPKLLVGDELRVKQILNNLLSNAFKYTMAGTVKLSVSAKTAGADGGVFLVFCVSDTGQGMTEEQISMLFDEYAQFNQETNRATEGTGLGMSITRNLVSLMNGEITVDSELGKGTVFTVRLPQVISGSEVLGREVAENLRRFRTDGRVHMKRSQISREPMPYGSVLIVDDVETNIYVAKGLLAPYGIKIDTADSGFAALKKIKQGKVYDIIFMDHMMPGMDGVETATRLRTMGYDRPIVALTANAVAGQAELFTDNYFDDFISKPIDTRRLNAVLNKFVRDRQPPEVIAAARHRPHLKVARPPDTDTAPGEIKPEIAEIFVRDAKKSLKVMAGIIEKTKPFAEADLRNYVVHVHGTKSSLANIGRLDLSATALKLEQAGRAGDIEVIVSETPAFLDALRTLTAALENEAENAEGRKEEDTAYLHEKLLLVKTACSQYDENTADELIVLLKQKAWTPPIKELLSEISGHLLHSDFDEVADAIDEFLRCTE